MTERGNILCSLPILMIRKKGGNGGKIKQIQFFRIETVITKANPNFFGLVMENIQESENQSEHVPVHEDHVIHM
jgi:hypothetical protein